MISRGVPNLPKEPASLATEVRRILRDHFQDIRDISTGEAAFEQIIIDSGDDGDTDWRLIVVSGDLKIQKKTSGSDTWKDSRTFDG